MSGPEAHILFASHAATALEQVQSVCLPRPSVDQTTSQLMARQKGRSGARPGEALCEEQERGHGGLSASVEVRNRASEISAGVWAVKATERAEALEGQMATMKPASSVDGMIFGNLIGCNNLNADVSPAK